MNNIIPIAAVIIILTTAYDLFRTRKRTEEGYATLRKINLAVLAVAVIVLAVYIYFTYIR